MPNAQCLISSFDPGILLSGKLCRTQGKTERQTDTCTRDDVFLFWQRGAYGIYGRTSLFSSSTAGGIWDGREMTFSVTEIMKKRVWNSRLCPSGQFHYTILLPLLTTAWDRARDTKFIIVASKAGLFLESR